MFRECRNCGADFYKEAYSATCPDCNRQFAAEKRAANAAQRNREAQNGYQWGYEFYEEVGQKGRNYTFKLEEDGGLSFTVDYLDYFLGGQPNAQFVQGMSDRLHALGWNKRSHAERFQHIKDHAYFAGKSPNCHQSFHIPWEQAGLIWRLNRSPGVKFISNEYKRAFINNISNVLDIDGIIVSRNRIFGNNELQSEFDRGLRDYVLENRLRALEHVIENTLRTENYIGDGKRWFLIIYLTFVTLGILPQFHHGFGWIGIPIYIVALFYIWKYKGSAWNSIWRGPLRYTVGMHFVMSFVLMKLNDLYGHFLT